PRRTGTKSPYARIQAVSTPRASRLSSGNTPSTPPWGEVVAIRGGAPFASSRTATGSMEIAYRQHAEGERILKRSTDRILTTHPGRLPNPSNFADVMRARRGGDQQE